MENNNERNLDPNVSYKRQTTALEIWTIIVGVLTLSAFGFGIFFLIAAMIIQFTTDNIKVKDLKTGVSKFATRFEWNQYCKEHGINYWHEYRNEEKKLVEQHNVVSAVSNNETIDDLAKYKKLLDDGAINQDEFDKKKKEILGL